MNNYEKQMHAMMRCLAAESERDREQARAELRTMLGEARSAAPVDLDGVVANALFELGVPDHLRGHRILAEAIKLVAEDPEMLKGITKVLYPNVAKACQTTPSRVERAIRYAIEVSWERIEYGTAQKFFGCITGSHRGNPTNSEFIARVVNVVRQQMKESA